MHGLLFYCLGLCDCLIVLVFVLLLCFVCVCCFVLLNSVLVLLVCLGFDLIGCDRCCLLVYLFTLYLCLIVWCFSFVYVVRGGFDVFG